MNRSNKKKSRRGRTAQSPSPPVDQDSMRIIQVNLKNVILSNSLGAGISRDEAHGIVEAVALEYRDRRYQRQRRSCLKPVVRSKSISVDNNNNEYKQGIYMAGTTTMKGCSRVTFDLNVSVLEYTSDDSVNGIVDVNSMASLLCDYMPDTITFKEAQSIVRISINQSLDEYST